MPSMATGPCCVSTGGGSVSMDVPVLINCRDVQNNCKKLKYRNHKIASHQHISHQIEQADNHQTIISQPTTKVIIWKMWGGKRQNQGSCGNNGMNIVLWVWWIHFIKNNCYFHIFCSSNIYIIYSNPVFTSFPAHMHTFSAAFCWYP